MRKRRNRSGHGPAGRLTGRPPGDERACGPGGRVVPMPHAALAGSGCTCGGGCPSCRAGPAGAGGALRLSVPGGAAEREAARVAAGEGTAGVPARAAGPAGAPIAAPVAGGIRARLGGGRALPASLRDGMAARLGADPGPVRLHTDRHAALLSGALGARAFTVGRDVFFAAGGFAPATRRGRDLIAHELTHTLQQRPGEPARTVYRDGDGTTAPVTATAILPFARGDRMQMDQLLNETLFGLLEMIDPDTATMLRVMRGQRATVTTASDDLVEARLDRSEVTLADGTFRDVRLRLARRVAGTFDLVISGETGSPSRRTTLFARRDMTATRQRGGAIVLATGTGRSEVRQLRVSGTKGGDAVDIAVLKESFIQEVPPKWRGLVPERIEALRLSALPPASAPDEAVERAAAAISRRAEEGRRVPRQEVSVAAGGQFGATGRALLEGAWQYNLQPVRVAGSFFQVPLRVALQYAPSSSVLAQFQTGVGTSLGALDIPLNLRLLIGGAGGRVVGPEVGGERPLVSALGLTLGVGAGYEIGRWRINVRYDHLFNLLTGTDVPGIDTVTGGLGWTF